MNEGAFRNSMNRIFAAHAKAPPSRAAIDAVWYRVAEFPDAFMDWAAAKLCDYEKLPGNLGYEIKGMYSQWRSETGQPRQERHCCPDCDRQIPGFFYWWQRDESGHVASGMCRCLCNNDPSLDPMPRKSKAQAEREGMVVMPKGNQGSPAGFEIELFGQSGESEPGGIGKEAVKLSRSPVGIDREYHDTVPF